MSTDNIISEYSDLINDRIKQYYDLGILKKEIRSYEVSVWTLLDEFITVLKWSDVEQKGRIEEPELTIRNDGTEEFRFSIPMYYYKEGKLIENPNWYSTLNGTILEGMRKIKVIFNKDLFDPREVLNWREICRLVYTPINYCGNVDLYNRYIVPSSVFLASGYSNFNGTYGTLFSHTEVCNINGISYDVIYTPILSSGRVLTYLESSNYINDIFVGKTSVISCYEADANDYSIILAILPEDTVNHHSDWCIDLHNRQAEWDTIRASMNWFDEERNPTFVHIGEATYNYYLDYLRTLNTFEFIITSVTEGHDNDVLTCDITCEGMAFHELGKIGYTLSLSLENFELLYADWYSKFTLGQATAAEEPILSVDYWMSLLGIEKCPAFTSLMNPTLWYYDIQMNWNSFAGTHNRYNNKVYEDPYVSSWDYDAENNIFIPANTVAYREKARPVEGNQSNIYNLTLSIAEAFGIYCKYEYKYDENNHIIGRLIIFYNNFFSENEETLSFTYPHSSKRISRTIDSTEITTKLYVPLVDDSSTLLGYLSITDSETNRSREDYILNFDYMHEVGAINDLQYQAVEDFEKAVYNINHNIILILNELEGRELALTDIKAKRTISSNSKSLDNDQLKGQNAVLEDILNRYGDLSTGEIIVSKDNPKFAVRIPDGNMTKIRLSEEYLGIRESSILIWKYELGEVGDEIQGTFTVDVKQNVIRNVPAPGENENSYVYLTYSYAPYLYQLSVIDLWVEKLAKDQAEFDALDNQYNSIEAAIEQLNIELEEKIQEKKQLLNKFLQMMGPALREGYWQPESYNDYGDQKYQTFNTSTTNTNQMSYQEVTNEEEGMFCWDDELFDSEEDIKYKKDILENEEYYPCIDISGIYNSNTDFATNMSEYSVVFRTLPINGYDNAQLQDYDPDNPKYYTIYNIGSLALLKFARIKRLGTYSIIPILVLIGAANLLDGSLKDLTLELLIAKMINGNVTICRVEASVDNGYKLKFLNTNNYLYENAPKFIDNPVGAELTAVYPRIRFSTLRLKNDSTNLRLKFNNKILTLYTDYYVLTRNKSIENNTDVYKLEYFITIKPETMVSTQSMNSVLAINYALSNAATSIYLDALKVSKENAYPKVSYEVDISTLNNNNLIKTLYRRLNLLVMINDVKLKFKDTFGYISSITMKLDSPDLDVIEVKNYKTKFEDLFSTIVALTESLLRNTDAFSNAIAGNIPLTISAMEATIDNNNEVLTKYLDTYYTTSGVMEDRLKELFTEAGNILSSGKSTLALIELLSERNLNILANFATKIADMSGNKLINSETLPADFKLGDIWLELDALKHVIARYVATTDGGFTKTYDGSIAAITGATLEVDAAAGIINIKAENELILASKGFLKISGNDVQIVGNKNVNIGGALINIGSATVVGADGQTQTYEASGINLFAEAAPGDIVDPELVTSGRVLIHPDYVLLAGARIEMVALEEKLNGYDNTTAMLILGLPTQDCPYGIWLGSKLGIALTSSNGHSSADVEIVPEHILLGKTGTGQNISGMEIRDNYIILASGGAKYEDNMIKGDIDDGLTGIKITRKSIGMATNDGSTISAFILDKHGLLMGSGITFKNNENYSNLTNTNNILTDGGGSYVYVGPYGIDICSAGILRINTNNVSISTIANGSSSTMINTLDDMYYFAVSSDLSAFVPTLADNLSNSISSLAQTSGIAITRDNRVMLNVNSLYAGNGSSIGYETYKFEDGISFATSTLNLLGLKGSISWKSHWLTRWPNSFKHWTQNHLYLLGDIVQYNNEVYQCEQLHLSTNSITPSNNTYWYKLILFQDGNRADNAVWFHKLGFLIGDCIEVLSGSNKGLWILSTKDETNINDTNQWQWLEVTLDGEHAINVDDNNYSKTKEEIFNDVAFSVDPYGNLYCKNIICENFTCNGTIAAKETVLIADETDGSTDTNILFEGSQTMKF